MPEIRELMEIKQGSDSRDQPGSCTGRPGLWWGGKQAARGKRLRWMCTACETHACPWRLHMYSFCVPVCPCCIWEHASATRRQTCTCEYMYPYVWRFAHMSVSLYVCIGVRTLL